MKTKHHFPESPSGAACNAVAPLLPLVAQRLLEPDEAEAVRAHVSGCDSCRARLAAYDRLDDALRQHVEQIVSFPIHMEELMSRIHDEEQPELIPDLIEEEPEPALPLRALSVSTRPARREPRRVITWMSTIAAVLVIGLITTALVASRHPNGGNTGNRPSATTGAPSSVTVYGSADYTSDSSADSTLFALDGATGKPRWTDTSKTIDRVLPVVENGVFYIGGSDGKVAAYQASSGKLLWSQKLLDHSFVDQVADGVVIAHSFDQSKGQDPFPGTIFALDATTGHELWHVAKDAIPQAFVDGVIYAAREGDLSIQHGVLYALNAKDGSERWELQTQGSPTVKQVVDGQVYVLSMWGVGDGTDTGSLDTRSVLYSVDAASGQQRWVYPKNPAYLIDPVAVANGLIFIPSNAGNGNALRELDAVSTSDGSLRWKASFDLPYMRAYYDNGTIYVGMDGAVNAYQASDGSLLSNTPTAKGAELDVVANGVYYLDASSGVYAVDAGSGKELWHSQQAGSIEAVVNGLIYITTTEDPSQAQDASQLDNEIVALDAGTGKVRWTYKLGHDAPYNLIVK